VVLVQVTAVRCIHCLADIPVRPEHGGECPFCRGEIQAEAIRCKHCHATLVSAVPPVPARVQRPARIMRRRGSDQPEAGRPEQENPVADAAGTHADSACEQLISTRYGVYHLVDEGSGPTASTTAATSPGTGYSTIPTSYATCRPPWSSSRPQGIRVGRVGLEPTTGGL
jgi:hypothetical protein